MRRQANASNITVVLRGKKGAGDKSLIRVVLGPHNKKWPENWVVHKGPHWKKRKFKEVVFKSSNTNHIPTKIY